MDRKHKHPLQIPRKHNQLTSIPKSPHVHHTPHHKPPKNFAMISSRAPFNSLNSRIYSYIFSALVLGTCDLLNAHLIRVYFCVMLSIKNTYVNGCPCPVNTVTCCFFEKAHTVLVSRWACKQIIRALVRRIKIHEYNSAIYN